MCLGSSSGGADAAVAQQKAQQAAIQAATNQINKTFSGFDNNFYNQRTQAYENYALPQLGQQLQQTQNQLGFKLAGQGLGRSSAAKQLGESLATETGVQKQNIANEALAQTNQLKQNIAQQQSNLISQANVANDPSSVATQALSTASSFNAPSSFPALGQAFSNWANMYLGKVNNSIYSNPNMASVNSPFNYSLPTSSYTGGYGSSFSPLSYSA